MDSPTVWLTLTEAAAYTKLAKITLLRAVKLRELCGYRIGGGRTIWRFRAADLDAWLQSGGAA